MNMGNRNHAQIYRAQHFVGLPNPTKYCECAYDDPRAPITICKNRTQQCECDRPLMFSMYDYDRPYCDDTAKWKLLFDAYCQKELFKQQLEEANKIMAQYREKFGDLDDDTYYEDDKKKINKNKTKSIKNYKSESKSDSTGKWFTYSSVIIALAILGGVYYLKR